MPPQRKKLIICIDGGGIRGVIPLVHLREIQLLLHRNLQDLQPEWWGTSTGALISASLNVQRDPRFIHRIQSVLDLYEFRSRSTANPPRIPNPARAFEKLLERNFGERSMREFTNLNVVACDELQGSARIFDSTSECSLADAVRASCAVPGLFPPKTINGRSYVDGFFVAKNPAALAMAGKQPDKDTIVLSLGCGVLRDSDEIEESVARVHEEISKSSASHGFVYFRFDPILRYAADAMQNATPKNIFNLKRDAVDHIHEHWEKLAELATLLNH